MDKYKEWLASLEVGSPVAIERRFGRGYYLTEVRRVNKKTFNVAGKLYDKETGWSKGGGSWNTSRIEPVNQEMLDLRESQCLIKKIRAHAGRASLPVLRTVYKELIDDQTKEEEDADS